MLACEASVVTLWAWASSKRTPARGQAVHPRRGGVAFPYAPSASARSVSTVISEDVQAALRAAAVAERTQPSPDEQDDGRADGQPERRGLRSGASSKRTGRRERRGSAGAFQQTEARFSHLEAAISIGSVGSSLNTSQWIASIDPNDWMDHERCSKKYAWARDFLLTAKAVIGRMPRHSASCDCQCALLNALTYGGCTEMLRMRALSGILLLSLLSQRPLSPRESRPRSAAPSATPPRAVIVGAKVSVKNEATGLTRDGETNASGSFAFADLPVGTYTIDVEYPGFKIVGDARGVLLNVADVRAGRLHSSRPARSPSRSASRCRRVVGQDDRRRRGRPHHRRSRSASCRSTAATSCSSPLLMPGVSAADGLNIKDKGLLGGSDLSVSGGAVTANLWTVDGANNNDVGSNRTILVYPSVDAIEEFKVHRNSYGAEFGQAGGGQINIVTRGGTNEFHGSGFYFGRNDALNATNYFLKQAGPAQGPAEPQRLRLELRRPDHQGQAALLRVAGVEPREARHGRARRSCPRRPSAQGDFSGAGDRGLHAARRRSTRSTGAAFPGNRIPADRLSAGGLAVPAALSAAQHARRSRGAATTGSTRSTRRINWRQENIRARLDAQQHDPPDGRATRRTAGRTTSPSAQHEPLGRRPVPGRRLELGPAGQVAHGPAQPQHRLEGRQHA